MRGRGSFNDRGGLFGVGLLSHTSRGSGRGTAGSEEVVEAAVVAYSRGRGRGTAEAVQRQRQTHSGRNHIKVLLQPCTWLKQPVRQLPPSGNGDWRKLSDAAHITDTLLVPSTMHHWLPLVLPSVSKRNGI